nr:endonuclease/exonuclease/phosphatase family protein [Seleniivibrio sp.]
MKIISFNVNSIRTRLHQIQKLIDRHSPDIIGLQETKVQDHEFPVAEINGMGYHVEFTGQKTHYGVAVMSKKSSPACPEELSDR